MSMSVNCCLLSQQTRDPIFKLTWLVIFNTHFPISSADYPQQVHFGQSWQLYVFKQYVYD